jgi:hypothetical protein
VDEEVDLPAQRRQVRADEVEGLTERVDPRLRGVPAEVDRVAPLSGWASYIASGLLSSRASTSSPAIGTVGVREGVPGGERAVGEGDPGPRGRPTPCAPRARGAVRRARHAELARGARRGARVRSPPGRAGRGRARAGRGARRPSNAARCAGSARAHDTVGRRRRLADERRGLREDALHQGRVAGGLGPLVGRAGRRAERRPPLAHEPAERAGEHVARRGRALVGDGEVAGRSERGGCVHGSGGASGAPRAQGLRTRGLRGRRVCTIRAERGDAAVEVRAQGHERVGRHERVGLRGERLEVRAPVGHHRERAPLGQARPRQRRGELDRRRRPVAGHGGRARSRASRAPRPPSPRASRRCSGSSAGRRVRGPRARPGRSPRGRGACPPPR